MINCQITQSVFVLKFRIVSHASFFSFPQNHYVFSIKNDFWWQKSLRVSWVRNKESPRSACWEAVWLLKDRTLWSCIALHFSGSSGTAFAIFLRWFQNRFQRLVIYAWNWWRHDPFICLLHKLIWMRAFNLCPEERDREDEKSEGICCLSPHPPYILGINFEPQGKRELETQVEEAIIGGAGDRGYNNGTSNVTSGPGGKVLHRDGDKASFTLNPSYGTACCHWPEFRLGAEGPRGRGQPRAPLLGRKSWR